MVIDMFMRPEPDQPQGARPGYRRYRSNRRLNPTFVPSLYNETGLPSGNANDGMWRSGEKRYIVNRAVKMFFGIVLV